MVKLKEQNMLWSSLPDQVKEDLIRMYEDYLDESYGEFSDKSYEAENKALTLENTYGKHNLVLWRKYCADNSDKKKECLVKDLYLVKRDYIDRLCVELDKVHSQLSTVEDWNDINVPKYTVKPVYHAGYVEFDVEVVSNGPLCMMSFKNLNDANDFVKNNKMLIQKFYSIL